MEENDIGRIFDQQEDDRGSEKQAIQSIELIILAMKTGAEFAINKGTGKPPKGTMSRSGGKCLISETPISWDYIKSEGKNGRLRPTLIAIVTEGSKGRNYHQPNANQIEVAMKADPIWEPNYDLSTHPQYMAPPRYGMSKISDLFTARQLAALTTFSDLVPQVRKRIYEDSTEASLADTGERSATAYAEAISMYLGLGVGRQANRLSTLCFWDPGGEKVQVGASVSMVAIVTRLCVACWFW